MTFPYFIGNRIGTHWCVCGKVELHFFYSPVFLFVVVVFE